MLPPADVLTTATSAAKQPSIRANNSSPNYMNPTRSSGAKTHSFKLARSSVKRYSKSSIYGDLDARRDTCSSILKHSNFSDYLTLNLGGTESDGTSVANVCPYTYCSLNGHFHAPVPPLKCFLSVVRGRMLKNRKSAKFEAPSPRGANATSDEKLEIEEVGSAGRKVPATCRTADSTSDFTEIDQNETNENGAVCKLAARPCQFAGICEGLNEEDVDENLPPKTEDEQTAHIVAATASEEQLAHSAPGDGIEETDRVDDDGSLAGKHIPDSSQVGSEVAKDKMDETDKDNEKNAIVEDSIMRAGVEDPTREEERKIRSVKPIKERVEPGKFNPREPNYLPLKPDQEAEKVALRRQRRNERKNAEEWMLDYALQKVVIKLAPLRKRKVALLVEAFETVIPIPNNYIELTV